jgi:peptide/nickel transport system ATP-binding protein
VHPIDDIFNAYPHQISGGQSQRVMLALALSGDPNLLIADEPTSALDTITTIEILRLLERLVRDRGLALLLISHDLEIVRGAVDRVAVMYAGQIVEEAPTDVIFSDPLHPYTQLLLASVPGAHPRAGTTARPVDPGRNPTDQNGCVFAARCPVARASCGRVRPELVGLEVDRKLRCPIAAEAWEAERGRP